MRRRRHRRGCHSTCKGESEEEFHVGILFISATTYELVCAMCIIIRFWLEVDLLLLLLASSITYAYSRVVVVLANIYIELVATKQHARSAQTR